MAQVYPYRQYTTADELASSNVNDIIHDSRGYLWFATDRGVSRFDGFKFTNYLYKEGLPFAKITSFAKNDKGRIIATSPYRGISLFDNNFHELMPASELSANDETIYTEQYIYSIKKGAYLAIGNIASKQFKQTPLDAVPYAIAKNNNQEIEVATDKGIFIISGDHVIKKPEPASTYAVYSLCYDGPIQYRGANGFIETQHADGSVTKTPVAVNGNIEHLIHSREGDFWFTIARDNRLYLLERNGRLTDLSLRLQIEGTQINKIFQDFEGNIWIATSGKGLLCIHHFYNTNYTRRDGLRNEYVTALETDQQGNIYIGTSGGLYHISNGTSQPMQLVATPAIKQVKYTGQQLFVWPIEGSQGETAKINMTSIDFSPSMIDKDADLLRSEIKNILGDATKNNTADHYIDFYDSLQVLGEVNDAYADDKHMLWLATKNGLRVSDAGEQNRIHKSLRENNVSCIVADNNGIIYFGGDNGLATYEKGKWSFYKQLSGKNIESVTSLAVDAKNRLWIGTLTGLFMWDHDAVIQFDTKNVLLSDEINALIFDKKNNYMWAGSSFGLSCINIEKFDQTKIYAPSAMFRNLRTADSIYRELDLHSDLSLHYKSSNFTIRFSAIHFSTPEGVKFLYKYDDAVWQPAIGRQIEFASMPYGKHTFLIKAIGERDIEGPVAQLNITVQTPFWATTWFKISAGIIIALLAYFIIRNRFNSIRKKQQERLELQAKIAELRHQALAASMNPHFIFNALNSIQQFINVRDTDEASEYLGKFARLIRIMLNSGGKTFITLSEELERLKYYLDLEQVRFGKKLTFHIEVDKKIKTDQTEIPNMVIQPIVENALWHGLLPANKDGLLNISFEKQNGTLKVVVDDNGIGINESRKRKKSGHVSLGIHMIEERLSLLKKLNGYEATITVNDKSDLNNTAHGTLVEIHLS